MLTVEDAQKFLQSLGITTIPDFVLELLVGQANAANDCLEENYPEATQKLIRLYLLGLLGLSQMTREISSERAPSGASRSWNYPELKTRWLSLYGLLRGLDKNNCVEGLIPTDPTQEKYISMFVATGGCMHDGGGV